MQRLSTQVSVGDAYAPLFTARLALAGLPEGDLAILSEAARHYGMANRVEVPTDRGTWIFSVRGLENEGTPEAAFLLASAGVPREQ